MSKAPVLQIKEFPRKRSMESVALKAEDLDVYTVQSLKEGIYYFCADEAVVISTQNGFIWMNEKTAEIVAEELTEILKDVKKLRMAGVRWTQKEETAETEGVEQ